MGNPRDSRTEGPETHSELTIRRVLAWLQIAFKKQIGADVPPDLLQEAALRVSIASSGNIRSPRAYVRRIALNVVRDQYRRQMARGGGNAVPIEDVFGEPALSYAADQEQALLLKQVILSMPELYRGVFLLNRFVGLSYQEIAVRLDISVKTVEWRMGRALAHCVAQLRD